MWSQTGNFPSILTNGFECTTSAETYQHNHSVTSLAVGDFMPPLAHPFGGSEQRSILITRNDAT